MHLVLRLRGGMYHYSSGRTADGKIICSGIDTHQTGPVAYRLESAPPHAPGVVDCPHCDVVAHRAAGRAHLLAKAMARLEAIEAGQPVGDGSGSSAGGVEPMTPHTVQNCIDVFVEMGFTRKAAEDAVALFGNEIDERTLDFLLGVGPDAAAVQSPPAPPAETFIGVPPSPFDAAATALLARGYAVLPAAQTLSGIISRSSATLSPVLASLALTVALGGVPPSTGALSIVDGCSQFVFHRQPVVVDPPTGAAADAKRALDDANEAIFTALNAVAESVSLSLGRTMAGGSMARGAALALLVDSSAHATELPARTLAAEPSVRASAPSTSQLVTKMVSSAAGIAPAVDADALFVLTFVPAATWPRVRLGDDAAAVTTIADSILIVAGGLLPHTLDNAASPLPLGILPTAAGTSEIVTCLRVVLGDAADLNLGGAAGRGRRRKTVAKVKAAVAAAAVEAELEEELAALDSSEGGVDEPE